MILWLLTIWLSTIWLPTIWLPTIWLSTIWLLTIWLSTIWLLTIWLSTIWLSYTLTLGSLAHDTLTLVQESNCWGSNCKCQIVEGQTARVKCWDTLLLIFCFFTSSESGPIDFQRQGSGSTGWHLPGQLLAKPWTSCQFPTWSTCPGWWQGLSQWPCHACWTSAFGS